MRQNASVNHRLPVSLPLCALYLLVAALLLSGVTMARYVRTVSGGDAARVVRFGALQIEEAGSVTENGQWLIAPGADITQQATVQFDGSEAACYVFLQVGTAGWTRDASQHRFSYGNGAKEWLVWNIEDGWSYLTDSGDSAVYYAVLPPNTPLRKAIVADGGRITVSPELRNSQIAALPSDFSLHFTAYAVQYDGFGAYLPEGYTPKDHALAAWQSVSRQ